MRQLRVPVKISQQPEGTYLVTCPALPELITEGDTFFEAVGNVEDALAATIEIYHDTGRDLPAEIFAASGSEPVVMEAVAPYEVR